MAKQRAQNALARLYIWERADPARTFKPRGRTTPQTSACVLPNPGSLRRAMGDREGGDEGTAGRGARPADGPQIPDAVFLRTSQALAVIELILVEHGLRG